ncbi:MAG: UDP-N-acetylglucosamine pyrophosphorylase [Syntrophales bacterium]|nr:UDP-N-acetylglucosamine pyrophosphorylase [Syntrophales bacterium]
MPNPEAVEIGEEVLAERISGDGVVIHGGAKISGAKTLIAAGVRLGHEAPATVVDCQVGPDVELKGGFFHASVFLDRVNMSSGAHVREGCILEEESNCAHTVGLKQTILFPFVTLGSLINFCDCFMAGGNSRKNHSEVGSSYIHFNYTPNQDKATASLIGDVPQGVMLNQAPIFLGGQGGMVGPIRLGYGTVILAGTILRRDYPEGGKLIGQSIPKAYEISFHQGFYPDIKRRVCNNINYIANMIAFAQWYDHIRRLFMGRTDFGRALHEGVIEKLAIIVAERLNRMRTLAGKMDLSIRIAERITSGPQREGLILQSRELQENWPAIEKCFTNGYEKEVSVDKRDEFISLLQSCMNGEGNYINTIRGLDHDLSALGTSWLQEIIDNIKRRALEHLPSCRA